MPLLLVPVNGMKYNECATEFRTRLQTGEALNTTIYCCLSIEPIYYTTIEMGEENADI